MTSTEPTVVVLGAALSANKGAASMLLALIDNAEEFIPRARVLSLSTYPEADQAVNTEENLEIVSYKPLSMAILNFPLALLIWTWRRFGSSGRVFARTNALRAMIDASVIADLAGISFSDGRGLVTLAYNCLMTGIPLLVGAPVVKCSQALGPFDGLNTRVAAKIVLKHLAGIVARGSSTYTNLRGLELDNVKEGADLAFLMHDRRQTDEEASDIANSIIDGAGFFVVSPSSVVRSLCDASGMPYVPMVSELIVHVSESTGLMPLLVAHSGQPGQGESRMNDMPVCREIATHLAISASFIDQSLDPRVLRAIIGKSRLLLASRFHAMISGLATQTPTVVLGWSHKYREVMAEFGLQEFVVPFSEFNVEALTTLAVKAVDTEADIRDAIAAALPRIMDSSRVSLGELANAMEA